MHVIEWGCLNSNEYECCISAFSANGKDVIVDFPQQSHWTGLLSEMELVPSVHPGVRFVNIDAHSCPPPLTSYCSHIVEEHFFKFASAGVTDARCSPSTAPGSNAETVMTLTSVKTALRPASTTPGTPLAESMSQVSLVSY